MKFVIGLIATFNFYSNFSFAQDVPLSTLLPSGQIECIEAARLTFSHTTLWAQLDVDYLKAQMTNRLSNLNVSVSGSDIKQVEIKGKTSSADLCTIQVSSLRADDRGKVLFHWITFLPEPTILNIDFLKGIVELGIEHSLSDQRLNSSFRFSENHWRLQKSLIICEPYRPTSASTRPAGPYPGEREIIAVIDSGVDYNQPLIRDHLISRNGQLVGLNEQDESCLPFDHYGLPGSGETHGTGVAYSAIKGDPNLALLPIKIRRGGRAPDWAKALRFAYDNGARIVNISWGPVFGDGKAIFQDLIHLIPQYSDVLFVIAAGNRPINIDLKPEYPGALAGPNVIVVGAVDSSGNLASFSAYGARHVSLGAIGVDLEVARPRRAIISEIAPKERESGTSHSAPNIARLGGRMRVRNKTLRPERIIEAIETTVRKSSALDGIFKTSGVVDETRAMRSLEH